MVMGDDSCSRSCGFETQHSVLNGHFFTLFCCKNCIVCLKRPKTNEKEAGLAHFKKQNIFQYLATFSDLENEGEVGQAVELRLRLVLRVHRFRRQRI